MYGVAKANGPKSLSASAALSFRAAQKHLVAKIELRCVVFRQQAGNLFIEHLSVTRKRMDLWRIATESLKHHKQLSANIDQGDIVGLYTVWVTQAAYAHFMVWGATP